ncbi:transposase [Roseibium aggregatum]|uniref:transposase n=1 Tax=Roseibium aggregatum TaxID=187304 RepID=UPI003F5422D4
MKFAANEVRLQLHALAYNLANFVRTMATLEVIETWSLASLRERLIKTGSRLVRHGDYAIFQMAAAVLPRKIFARVLDLINGLRGPPDNPVPA